LRILEIFVGATESGIFP